MSNLVTPLGAIKADIVNAQSVDDLKEVVGALTSYLDGKRESSESFGDLVISEDFSLAGEDINAVEEVGAGIFGRLAELEGEKIFWHKGYNIMDTTIKQVARVGRVTEMVNRIGDTPFATEGLGKVGAEGAKFFDMIEGTIASRDAFNPDGDVEGFKKLLDAHVEGLRDFAEYGSNEMQDWATYGLDKYGYLMSDETKEKMGDIAVQHAERIKMMTVAVILERFQPTGKAEEPDDDLSFDDDADLESMMDDWLDDPDYLAHPELRVENPDDYPGAEKYREWVRNDDLDPFIDQIFAESITAGRDMLRFAREEDKPEMATNYIFAIGFVKKIAELNLLDGTESYSGYNSKINQKKVMRDLQRFIEQLPEGIDMPEGLKPPVAAIEDHSVDGEDLDNE